jgi:hypothetical protein
MGLKTAFSQARIVTFGVLAAAVWILLTVLQVFERLGPLSSGGVGQTPISGLVGLAVMGGLLAVLAVLYSELGETEPSPDPWPPE